MLRERGHTNKAVRVEEPGGADVLRLVDIAPIEAPGPGGSLQNYLRTPEELMRRANDVIAGIRARRLKLKIGHVLPLAQRALPILWGR